MKKLNKTKLFDVAILVGLLVVVSLAVIVFLKTTSHEPQPSYFKTPAVKAFENSLSQQGLKINENNATTIPNSANVSASFFLQKATMSGTVFESNGVFYCAVKNIIDPHGSPMSQNKEVTIYAYQP
jgi:hypothetical protein